MPAITTLAFYREPQTLESFEKQRPKSLAAFRTSIYQALQDLRTDLQHLEKNFANPHENQEDFIRHYGLSLRRMLNATEQKDVKRSSDAEQLIDRINWLGDRSVFYVDDVRQLKALQAHIDAFLPNSFNSVIEKLKIIRELMFKYCLSFYVGPTHVSPDNSLETAFKYEQQRNRMMEDTWKLMQSIAEKCAQFRSVGLDFERLSHNVQALGRRMGCSAVPFLLLFEESQENLRDAIKILSTWLEIDGEYVEALANDIQNVQLDLNRYNSEHHQLHAKMHQLHHRRVNLQRFVSSFKADETQFVQRNLRAQSENHKALVDVKKCELKIERSLTQLQELRKMEEFYSASEVKEKREDSKLQLRLSKGSLPKLTKRLNFSEEKVNHLTETIDNYRNQEKTCDQLEVEERSVQRQLKALDEKCARLEKYQGILRTVLALKTSSETLKKIYHNMQLESRLQWLFNDKRRITDVAVFPEYSKGDPLNRSIRTTARHIEKDWARLYFALPFHPTRGEQELQDDISKIYLKFVRGSRRELAMAALITWRRLHTRANVDGLLTALRAIGQQDLATRVEKIASTTPSQMQSNKTSSTERSLSPTSKIILQCKQKEERRKAEELKNAELKNGLLKIDF